MAENKPISIKDLSYEHQQAVEAMKGNLLMVFINRLGGKISIPISEVDTADDFALMFRLNTEAQTFEFEVVRKDGEPNKPPVKLTELNGHTRFIFGRPNFVMSPVAHRLRELGHKIPRKAEDEQAHAIHFMLNMYELHGSRWREEVESYLNADEVKGES